MRTMGGTSVAVNVGRWVGCFESNANRGPRNRLLSEVLECCEFNLWLCFEFHGTMLFGRSPIGKQALCLAAGRQLPAAIQG